MKSGKDIYKAVVSAKDKPKRVRRLGNGALRSLAKHAVQRNATPTEIGEEVLALVMCEVFTRFLDKGRDVL